MTSAFQPDFEFLRVTGLHAFYGESHILHGIDFVVNRGEVVTLLGRNGAGRTTTLRAIMGLTGRRVGSIMINGREAVRMAPHEIAHLGVGYCPEERGIFASLTAEENLLLPPAVATGGMGIDEMLQHQLERGHMAAVSVIARGLDVIQNHAPDARLTIG